MARAVGVDWGSNGWVCASLDDDQTWSASVQPSIFSVWETYGKEIASPILVDIPIGLTNEGVRKCDRNARSVLGARRQSVFLTPPRPVLSEPTYEKAKDNSTKTMGHSLTTQAWGILPRIKEVDDFVGSEVDPGMDIRESHPEVCFRKLAPEEDELSSKHGDDGVAARKEILDEHVDGSSEAYDCLVEKHIECQPAYARRFRSSNRDDLLDAMALAVTSYVGGAELEQLGGDQEDSLLDRPIEIVYATR